MVKKRWHPQGYTLIEMMIVLVILGLVVVSGPTLITHLIRFYQMHNAKVEIQRDARSCLDTINRFLRQATSYSVRVDQATGQPPFSRVTFTTVQGEQIMFYQSGNMLYHVGTSTGTLSKNLRFIAFTYPRSDDPTIISVAMTMEKDTYQGGRKALELSIEKVRIMN